MQDMADATQEAASMASQYGVKVDEMSALIGTATAKTRESGSETGNAIKAILVNTQNVTNKEIVKAFNAANVSMTEFVDGSERLKNPIKLLKELSDVFTSEPEGSTVRANILTKIGGKYHANTLSAILSDWSTYEKMLNDYSEGGGSALSEAAKSADNWNGRINKLSNSWTKLVDTFTNQDSIKGIITVLQNLFDVLDKIAKKIGVIPTLITAVAGSLQAVKSFKGEGRGKMFPLIKYALVDTGGNTERVYIHKQECLGKIA